MSCYPPCQVPDLILPKKLQDRTKSNRVGMKSGMNCTSIQMQRIRQRREKCNRPAVAEMLKCSVCQEEQRRRAADADTSQQKCYLENYVKRYHEIPFLWKPPYEPIKFLGYGYKDTDCFQKIELDNPCKLRAIWKKKAKKMIKDLSKHYNEKVTAECEHPVENYIRKNMDSFYHPCGWDRKGAAYEPQSLPRCHYTKPYVGCNCLNIKKEPGY